MIKVLIVEDDEVTAMNLTMSLEKLGYSIVSIAGSASSAKNKLKIYSPDIILIDIGLNKSTSGIEFAQFIYENIKIPFIFLTAYSDNNILSKAKKTEPYGYIVKPFEPLSLHTTIQMALYRSEKENKRDAKSNELIESQKELKKLLFSKKFSDKPRVEFGDGYSYDAMLKETFYNNQKIKLTKKENAFIGLLVAQLGSIVDFNQAIDYVWESKNSSENSVRTLVWRLRNKLPSDVIKNASGIGYYLDK